MKNKHNAWLGGFALATLLASATAFGHGDVVPQNVDTEGLKPLGEE